MTVMPRVKVTSCPGLGLELETCWINTRVGAGWAFQVMVGVEVAVEVSLKVAVDGVREKVSVGV